MKLTQLFTPEGIIPDLKAHTKSEALSELASKIASLDPKLNREAVLATILEREKLGSTGIGMNVAIPHGKLADAKKILTCMARSRKGIDFESQDGEKVHLFFAILAPENAAGLHLKILAKLSRLLKEKKFREELIEAPDAESLFQLFAREEESF